MKWKLHPRRPSPAMVVAVVALCSSLAGGAVAGTLITGKDIAKKAIGKKHIRKSAVNTKKVENGTLLAKDFKPGQFVAGAPGPRGPEGPEGPRGPRGAKGDPGPAGEFPSTLPSGRTIRGQYAIEGPRVAGTASYASAYSFVWTLAQVPNDNFIAHGDGPSPECPGTADEPQAAPGELCIYESNIQSRPAPPTILRENRHGFALELGGGAGADGSNFWSYGSWAVTAP